MSSPTRHHRRDQARENLGDEQQRQLTTLAGWRQFVDQAPTPPELLPDRDWARLDELERLTYDEDRLNHHARLLVVATPTICKVITEGRRLSYLNRNAHSGRCGLILSGPARTGKTTAITQLGKTLEVIHRQRHPSGTRGEQIAGRFGMIRTTAFPRGEHWTGLIAALEHALRLHRHHTGTLAGLADYLHRRTTGMIGSLLRLIRSAAIQAILDGTEQITRATLDSIDLDIAAEKNNTRTATVSTRRPRESSNS